MADRVPRFLEPGWNKFELMGDVRPSKPMDMTLHKPTDMTRSKTYGHNTAIIYTHNSTVIYGHKNAKSTDVKPN